MRLDVGCGNRKLGDINIDIDPSVNPDYVADGASMPMIKNEIADEIFCYEVIEHVENPKKLLLELNRVLKPKGKLRLSTPNPYLWRRLLREMFGLECKVAGNHINCFTKAELGNLFMKTNFKAIFMEYGNLPWDSDYQSKWLLLDRLIPIKAFSNRRILCTVKKEK